MTRRPYHILEKKWVFDVNLTLCCKSNSHCGLGFNQDFTSNTSFGKGIEFLSQTHIF